MSEHATTPMEENAPARPSGRPSGPRRQRHVGTFTLGAACLALGSMLLLHQQGFITWHALTYLGPSLLIVFGLEVLTARLWQPEGPIRYSGFSIVVLILALLTSTASGAGVWTAPWSAAAHVKGELPVTDGVRQVEIRLPAGVVNVKGVPGDRVTFDGHVPVRQEIGVTLEESADKQWVAEQRGETLVLQVEGVRHNGWHFGWFLNGVAPQLTVTVPPQLQLYVQTANGRIEVSGFDAPVAVHTSNAKVNVSDVNSTVLVTTSNAGVTVANVSGDVEVRTSNGDVELRDVRAAVTAKSSNAGITAESAIAGPWRLTTSNGRIALTVPSETNADIDASTSNARLSGNVDWTLRNSRGTRGTARLGAGGPTVVLDTSNSTISVDVGR